MKKLICVVLMVMMFCSIAEAETIITNAGEANGLLYDYCRENKMEKWISNEIDEFGVVYSIAVLDKEYAKEVYDIDAENLEELETYLRDMLAEEVKQYDKNETNFQVSIYTKDIYKGITIYELDVITDWDTIDYLDGDQTMGRLLFVMY